MKAKNKVLPPPDLLRKVMLIADLKETLPFSKKGLFNKILGIFCQRYSLPQGASFYTAGGTFFRKLRFTWEHNGVITVQTYKPGNWELAVEIAYQRIGHPAGYPVLGDFINTEKSIVLDMEFIKAADKTIDMVRNIPTLGDDDLFRLWRKWDKPETASTFERAALLMELTKRGIADYKIRGWRTSSAEAVANSPSLLDDSTLRKRWKDLEWEKETLEKSRRYWKGEIYEGEESEAAEMIANLGAVSGFSLRGIEKRLKIWEREIEEKEKALKEEIMKRGYMDANGRVHRKRRAPKRSGGQR